MILKNNFVEDVFVYDGSVSCLTQQKERLKDLETSVEEKIARAIKEILEIQVKHQNTQNDRTEEIKIEIKMH